MVGTDVLVKGVSGRILPNAIMALTCAEGIWRYSKSAPDMGFSRLLIRGFRVRPPGGPPTHV